MLETSTRQTDRQANGRARTVLLPTSTESHKKNPANAKGNAQQRCMFESPVKQNQSPDGARRPTDNYL